MTAAEWDERYRSSHAVWSGDPNPQLVTEVSGLPPGRALDAGSGEGADAMWLAARGWHVTAVDISTVAVERSATLAKTAGDTIAQSIDWRQADLREWHPGVGAYDLVSVHFMQLPKDVRDPVFRTLAAAVVRGGTLLIVGHHPSDLETAARRPRAPGVLYAADEVLALLDPAGWRIVTNDARERRVTGPDGAAVTVRDAILRAVRI